MTEVKETKAQKVERLKREKLAWDHLDEIREFARMAAASVPPEWLGTYFRSWGIYTQGDGSVSLAAKMAKGTPRIFHGAHSHPQRHVDQRSGARLAGAL